MKIRYHKEFVKNYRKRIASNKKLSAKFQKQLEKFIENPKDASLRDHKLVGSMSQYRAFSMTGDIRVVYEIADGDICLYDIGSHNQVY